MKDILKFYDFNELLSDYDQPRLRFNWERRALELKSFIRFVHEVCDQSWGYSGLKFDRVLAGSVFRWRPRRVKDCVINKEGVFIVGFNRSSLRKVNIFLWSSRDSANMRDLSTLMFLGVPFLSKLAKVAVYSNDTRRWVGPFLFCFSGQQSGSNWTGAGMTVEHLHD